MVLLHFNRLTWYFSLYQVMCALLSQFRGEIIVDISSEIHKEDRNECKVFDLLVILDTPKLGLHTSVAYALDFSCPFNSPNGTFASHLRLLLFSSCILCRSRTFFAMPCEFVAKTRRLPKTSNSTWEQRTHGMQGRREGGNAGTFPPPPKPEKLL